MKNNKTGYIGPMPKSNGEYEVNGVKYTVSSRFSKNIKDEFISEKFERYIKSDFAHLTYHINSDILANEYVCQVASEKGEENAV